MSKKDETKKRIIFCKRCGCKFMVGMPGPKQYCKKCAEWKIRQAKNWEKRKSRYRKRRDRQLKCQNCGKDLTDNSKARKYCNGCREQIAKKQRRDYYKKYREKYLEYYRNYYKKPENKERHRKHARDYWERQRIAKLP